MRRLPRLWELDREELDCHVRGGVDWDDEESEAINEAHKGKSVKSPTIIDRVGRVGGHHVVKVKSGCRPISSMVGSVKGKDNYKHEEEEDDACANFETSCLGLYCSSDVKGNTSRLPTPSSDPGLWRRQLTWIYQWSRRHEQSILFQVRWERRGLSRGSMALELENICTRCEREGFEGEEQVAGEASGAWTTVGPKVMPSSSPVCVNSFASSDRVSDSSECSNILCRNFEMSSSTSSSAKA